MSGGLLYPCFSDFFSNLFFAGRKSDDVDISDILLWALFANRRELAEICWLKGSDHLSKYANRQYHIISTYKTFYK